MAIYSVIIAYLSLFALGLSDNVRGPLFSDVLVEFGLSDTTGSWLFALSSSLAFFAGAISPILLKRMRHWRLLQLGLFIMTAGLVFISLAKSFQQLLWAAAFFGLSIGFLGVCQNALVTIGTPSSRRKQWLSGLHSMYAISSFLAPTLVAFLASQHGTWREAYRWTALIPGIVLLVSFLLPREDVHKNSHETEELSPLEKEIDALTHLHWNHRERMKWQIVAGTGFALYVLSEILVSSRLGLYYHREHGFNLEDSSLQVSYFFLFLLAGRLTWTFVKMPWPLFHQLAGSLVLSALSLTLGLLWHPQFLVFSGLTMAPFFGLSMAYLADIFKGHTNQAFAVAMAIQSIFVVLMHLGVGMLSDHLDIRQALWVGPIALMASLLFLWRLHEAQKS